DGVALVRTGQREQRDSVALAQHYGFEVHWICGEAAPIAINCDIFKMLSSGLRIGTSAPISFKASITASVGRFPTSSSWAKGQPPSPPIAESKRRHPAL